MVNDRHVTLVCGPPCAGKTTWARHEAARTGATVLDWDDMARAAGSTARWNHPAHCKTAAEHAMLRAIDTVATAAHGQWIVIRAAPEASTREALANRLKADTVLVLNPGRATLHTRAAQRSRPGQVQASIARWTQRYTPSPIDERPEPTG